MNNHDGLRDDLALRTACGSDRRLAAPSTIGRLERRAARAMAWLIHECLMRAFLTSFAEPPRELVLDLDATDDRVHGKQEGRFFHGCYDSHCFLPLALSAATDCWRRICARRTATARIMRLRWRSCWWRGCGRRGRRCGS